MSDFNTIKSDLGTALREFAESEDLTNLNTRQFFNEAGMMRTAFRRRAQFISNVNSDVSWAIVEMENCNIEPMLDLTGELASIGIEIEFSSGEEGEYHLGETVEFLILTYKGKLKDRLKIKHTP